MFVSYHSRKKLRWIFIAFAIVTVSTFMTKGALQLVIWCRGKETERDQQLLDDVDGPRSRRTILIAKINALINDYQLDENKSLKEIKEQLMQNTNTVVCNEDHTLLNNH